MIAFGLCCLALAFLLPGHYSPWVSFEQQAVAGVGALLLGAAAFKMAGTVRHKLPLLTLVVTCVALIPLLQFLLAQVWFRADAVLASVYLLGFGASIWAATLIVERSGSSKLVSAAIPLVSAAAISTAFALIQWLQLHWSVFIVDLKPGDRPFGNLGQPNHLATLIALGIVSTVWLYEARKLGGAVSSLLVAFLGVGLVMTQSRTSWLFLLLLLLWWRWQRKPLRLQAAPLVITSGAVLFVIAVLLWQPVNDFLYLTGGPSLESRLEGGARRVHWPTLWDAAWRRPWFGYGWGQVVVAQQEATLQHPASGEWLLQSHNLLLDLLIYNGIPIGLALFGLLIWWFSKQIRACGSIDQWALLACVGAILLHALLEYPLDYAYFLFPLGLMMGALEALHPHPSGPNVRLPRAALGGVVTALAAMLVWVSVEYLEVQSTTRQLRFVLMGIGVDKVPDAPLPEVWLLDEPREHHRFWLTRARDGMDESTLDWMRKVSMREPRPAAMMRYALAAGLNGYEQHASDTLRKLCHIHPPAQCDDGRKTWSAAQAQYPVLQSIAYPSTPLELLPTSDRLRQLSAVN